MDVADPSSFGTIVFGAPQTEEITSPGRPNRKISVTFRTGEWRPPERLARFLPEGFSVPLRCYTGPDGLRRVVPGCSLEELIDLGAVGGLAILHGRRGFNQHVDYSYGTMFQIHQHVRGRAYRGTRGMKEHLTREFDYSRDLYVRRSGRLADNERDVLPNDLGINAEGEGRRLSVKQLTKLGGEAARAAGFTPTSKQAIAFGIYEAAKQNPLQVETERVPALVQAALFDLEPTAGAPSEELIAIVTERLLEALDNHLEDSQEEFDQWFIGPSNSLVKQIAQRTCRRGERLGREEVRQALLHLGWRAYQYVGQCIHVLMRTIKNAMPDPLSNEEQRLFERMHEAQPDLGGLPLALLAERLSFLRRAVLAIWDEPESQGHVRVLHRLLAYYASMARDRREADRQSKRRSPPSAPTACESSQVPDAGAEACVTPANLDEDRRGVSGRVAGQVQLIEDLHSARRVEENPFAQIAEHIRDLHGIECGAACEHWEYRRQDESETSVVIAMRCECGCAARAVELSMDDFISYAEAAVDWRRRRRPA